MINHKDIEKLAKISTLNKMYGCYRDTDSILVYDPNMTGGFTMNNEFPVVIVLDEGEDAYEEVYKVVEKYIKKDNLISLDDYYVTFELLSNGKPEMHTQLLRYDFDIGDYVWENDWWEGENTIIVYGLADISTLQFNGYHEREVIK